MRYLFVTVSGSVWSCPVLEKHFVDSSVRSRSDISGLVATLAYYYYSIPVHLTSLIVTSAIRTIVGGRICLR